MTMEVNNFELRQSDPRFRSPGIARKTLAKENVTIHSARNSRRAKSTEPTPVTLGDITVPVTTEKDEFTTDIEVEQFSTNSKVQENMSKPEMISCYRLLMNEKLRLERFLSIMSKNNEMARNRLESDLLDAMMCIEDLKQALELRMARDPREAEERRYLIRQNKKLLNQLYESAKKIERLELTKVEMKEQLELLDFQILEVENQKAMATGDAITIQISRLQEQLDTLRSELCAKHAELAAATARQQHLDNLVRELRRDNVELRDQLVKMDDVENSLAESDKPLIAESQALQSQLETQFERVRELEAKLGAARDYTHELESRLETMDMEKSQTPVDPVKMGAEKPAPEVSSTNVKETAIVSPPSIMPTVTQLVLHTFRPATMLASLNGMGALDLQASMDAAGDSSVPLGLRVPRVDDLLLQETIRTFHTLLSERDEEIEQLRKDLQPDPLKSISEGVLSESDIQTELDQTNQQTHTEPDEGFRMTAEQMNALVMDLTGSMDLMNQITSTSATNSETPDVFAPADLLQVVGQLRQQAEKARLHMTLAEMTKDARDDEKTDQMAPKTQQESPQSSDLVTGTTTEPVNSTPEETGYAEIISQTLRRLQGTHENGHDSEENVIPFEPLDSIPTDASNSPITGVVESTVLSKTQSQQPRSDSTDPIIAQILSDLEGSNENGHDSQKNVISLEPVNFIPIQPSDSPITRVVDSTVLSRTQSQHPRSDSADPIITQILRRLEGSHENGHDAEKNVISLEPVDFIPIQPSDSSITRVVDSTVLSRTQPQQPRSDSTDPIITQILRRLEGSHESGHDAEKNVISLEPVDFIPIQPSDSSITRVVDSTVLSRTLSQHPASDSTNHSEESDYTMLSVQESLIVPEESNQNKRSVSSVPERIKTKLSHQDMQEFIPFAADAEEITPRNSSAPMKLNVDNCHRNSSHQPVNTTMLSAIPMSMEKVGSSHNISVDGGYTRDARIYQRLIPADTPKDTLKGRKNESNNRENAHSSVNPQLVSDYHHQQQIQKQRQLQLPKDEWTPSIDAQPPVRQTTPYASRLIREQSTQEDLSRLHDWIEREDHHSLSVIEADQLRTSQTLPKHGSEFNEHIEWNGSQASTIKGEFQHLWNGIQVQETPPSKDKYYSYLLNLLCIVHRQLLSLHLWMCSKCVPSNQSDDRTSTIDQQILVSARKNLRAIVPTLLARLIPLAQKEWKNTDCPTVNSMCDITILDQLSSLILDYCDINNAKNSGISRVLNRAVPNGTGDKQRHLENAHVLCSIGRLITAPVDRLTLSELRFCHTFGGIDEIKLTAVCRQLLPPPNQKTGCDKLVTSLRRTICCLHEPSMSWLLAATDLFHLSNDQIVRVASRLRRLATEVRLPTSSIASSTNEATRAALICDILSLRVHLTCHTLVHLESNNSLSKCLAQNRQLRKVLDTLHGSVEPDRQNKTNGTLALLSSQMKLLLRIKNTVWCHIVEPLAANCPKAILRAVLSGICPSVLHRLQCLAATDRIHLLAIIYRVLCAMYFEPLCLRLSEIETSEVCCHSFTISLEQPDTSAQFHGYHVIQSSELATTCLGNHLREMLHCIWMLTGVFVWPDNVNIDELPSEQVWARAMAYKDCLIRVLFTSDSSKDASIQRLQTSLTQLTKTRPSKTPSPKLWLPSTLRCCFEPASFSVTARVFIAQSIALLHHYPETEQTIDRLTKSSRVLNVKRLQTQKASMSGVRFLRHLEAFTTGDGKQLNSNVQLSSFWSHTMNDLGLSVMEDLCNSDTHSRLMGSVLTPLEQTIRSKMNQACNRLLPSLQPLSYFTLINADSSKNDFDVTTSRIEGNIREPRQHIPSNQPPMSQSICENERSEPVCPPGASLSATGEPPSVQIQTQITKLESELKRLRELLPNNSKSPQTSEATRGGRTSDQEACSLSSGIRPASAPIESARNTTDQNATNRTPIHFSEQLELLREAGDVEVIQAQITVSERRRSELERRVVDLTEELIRARAESRTTEASLSAARRTEAALRRRLLVAMDMQGTGHDPNSNRYSTGSNLGPIAEMRDIFELQTSIIKSEATNASLHEAAQLDRARMHDQAMRIGQLEAEHRALLDRISVLQTTEASAQRGVVRLQALYEDMLREYSESRSQELSWRSRGRSRSNYRQNSNEADSNGGKSVQSVKAQNGANKLQERITVLESENQTLKETLKLTEITQKAVDSNPSGRCTTPACLEVRRLLKSFQDRFNAVLTQLTQTQQCLDALQPPSKTEPFLRASDTHGLSLIIDLKQQLTLLTADQVPSNESAKPLGPSYQSTLSNCTNLLGHLRVWLQSYVRRTEDDLMQLRTSLLQSQITSSGSEQSVWTACTERDNAQYPFSCSIRLNKKTDIPLLEQKEQELLALRAKLRDAEAELEARKETCAT